MKYFTLTFIILLAALSRLVVHPANFTPVAAMALASGAFFGRKSLGLLIPIAALLISDLIIGVYPGMFFNYLAMVVIFFLGSSYCQNLKFLKVAGATISGSVVFFVLSNFGVWLVGGLYPRTVEGFVNCYVNAIPFFGNTLLGDLTYSAVIFSAAYLLTSLTSDKTVRVS